MTEKAKQTNQQEDIFRALTDSESEPLCERALLVAQLAQHPV